MSTVATTFAPIVHFAWCDLTLCVVDTKDGQISGVSHYSADKTWDDGDLCVDMMMSHSEGDGSNGDPTRPYLQLEGDGDCTLEGLESLGAWLIARAAEMRLQIAHEGIPAQRTSSREKIADAVRTAIAEDEAFDTEDIENVATALGVSTDEFLARA